MKYFKEHIEFNDNHYLTFLMHSQLYGVRARYVIGMVNWNMITVIPNPPTFVVGIFLIKEKVLPILDLRRFFSPGINSFDKETEVLIVRVNDDGEEKLIGLVADKSSSIYELKPEEIQPTTEIDYRIDSEFVIGTSEINGQTLILLEIGKLFEWNILDKLEVLTVEDSAAPINITG